MPFSAASGELVQNGGFEQGLDYWLGQENLALESAPKCHQGLLALALGKPDPSMPAGTFQDVPVMQRRTYRVELFVAASGQEPPALLVDVRWVGCCGEGDSALAGGPIRIPASVVCTSDRMAWKAVSAYTGSPPPGTDAARIRLETTCGSESDGYVLIDDVSFTPRC